MANHATVTQSISQSRNSNNSLSQQQQQQPGQRILFPLPPPITSTQQQQAGGPEMDENRMSSSPPPQQQHHHRLPPIPPARPGPGAAIRINNSLHSSTPPPTTTAAATTVAHHQQQQQRVSSPLLTVPRVPAPTLPVRNNNATSTMSTTNNINNGGGGSRNVIVVVEPEVITLSQPRPDGERVRNEYIDTPLKGGLGGRLTTTSTPLHAETHPHIHIGGSPHDHLALVSPLGVGIGGHSSKTSSSKSLPHGTSSGVGTPSTSPALQRLQTSRRSLPITKQPISSSSSSSSAFPTKDSSKTTTSSLSYPSSRHGQRGAGDEMVGLSLVATNCNADATSCPALTSSSSSTLRTILSSSSSSRNGGKGGDSIICSECNRCRCQSCRTPRPLPSKWLCGDKCLCSAESCVDYVSCLCCVKGLFYHCGPATEDDPRYDDERLHRLHQHRSSSSSNSQRRRRYNNKGEDEDEVEAAAAASRGGSKSCADAPCSCAPVNNRLARWGCLASLSLVLPCLLCYWPLQGGVKVVEMCYQRCTQHGCQCDHNQQQQRRNNGASAPSSSSSNGGRGVISTGSSLQQQQHNNSKMMVVNSQPVSSSGKRLLDF